MEVVSKTRQDEFVQECINKLKAERMLTLSALFVPIRNTFGLLPQIQFKDIQKIKEKVSETDKETAKEIFKAICMQRYDLSWTIQRSNCVAAIEMIQKDPLLEGGEANELKRDIVVQLWEKYTKTNDANGLKSLSAYFPEVKIQAKNISPEARKIDIIEVLKAATSAKDETVRKAAEELAAQLSTHIKTIEIDKLEDNLALLEKVEYEKEKIEPIVINLLARYFFDWKKWISYMSKQSHAKYWWENLMEKYNDISLDVLIKILNDIWFPERQVEWKIRILINSFSAEQWSAAKEWVKLLHQIFDVNYEKAKYDICMVILSKVDLLKFYPDIKSQKDHVYEMYSKKESKLKDTKFVNIDAVITKEGRKEAIKFAANLCVGGNHHYLIMAYKKIYTLFRGDPERLWDMESLLLEINAGPAQWEILLKQNIVVSILEVYLDPSLYMRESKKELITTYIQKYRISEEILLTILNKEKNIFLEDPKGCNNQNGVLHPDVFFTYIDKFPGISRKEKQLQKLEIFQKINKKMFTIEKFVRSEEIISELKTEFKKICLNQDMSEVLEIANRNWELSEIEKFILWDICEVNVVKQKTALSWILEVMLDFGEYEYILPLIEKVGEKYWISNKKRISKVFDKALDREDFAYAESLFETYETKLWGEKEKKKIREKKIVKEIQTESVLHFTLEDILFNAETTLAFNQKVEKTKADAGLITFLISLVSKDEKIIHKTTKKLIETKINEMPIDSKNIDYFLTLYDNNQENIPEELIKIIATKILTYFNAKGVVKHQYRYIYYMLEKTYESLSEEHFWAWDMLFKYYRNQPAEYAFDLCKEMLAACDQVKEKKKKEEHTQVRTVNMQRAVKKCYEIYCGRILDALQALRPLPENLHKKNENILSVGEMKTRLKELYEFSVNNNMRQKYINNALQLWKEFYVLTQDKEGLAMLKNKYGIDQYSAEEVKNQLVSFLKDRDNIGVKELEELITLFGMENAADILFQLYPQYKFLWVLAIKSILSQYLWKFLIEKKWFGFVAIPDTLHLWGKEMVDRIFTVTEKWFISYYTKTKKQSPEMADREICDAYIEHSRSEFNKIRKNEPVFENVLEKFSKFLEQILAIGKPERFIDKLEARRDFPDFLQKLNAAEIKEKRRFLIADGMGMGKSLSAILAKEVIEAKSCLVVTPSNVVSTRKNYLSDIDIPEEKKQWYFGVGKAPRVLVIDSMQDIKENHISEYEYVIISQEKLSSDSYLQPLIDTNFDFMIVDEIHKLKNVSKGKRANALLQITEKIEEKNGYLCLLSWTPIPNKVGDIAMLLKLLYPQEYGVTDNRALVQSILAGDTLNLRSLLLPRMQMKKISDHIDMPELYSNYEYRNLGDGDISKKEKFYYDAILADEEISASQKIIKLRQLLLNPRILGITDIPVSTKAKKIWEKANILFKEKNKIVFFVNSFISGVLRPTEAISLDETFIAQMGLDKDIEVMVIDGENSSNRTEIQDEFNSSNKKIALFVSGSTADVGIDLTGGEYIVHVNEARTQAEKDQQDARVYRYGQKKDIESTTCITRASIEHGIHEYVELKQDAIMKLYYGIELSVLEKRILESDDPGTSAEVEPGSEKEINKWLTTYFRESAEELNAMYWSLKQGGTTSVEKLIAEEGEKLAGYYKDLSSRSYQANVNRWNGSIINQLMSQNNIQNLNILDLWSWPKMLYHHIADGLKDCVTSIDINPYNFTEEDRKSWKVKIWNFISLSSDEKSVDIISSSLSFNDTWWKPEKEDFERLACLYEMQRVLKRWGYAVISTIYSLYYPQKEKLYKILTLLWFEIDPKYSWNAESFGKQSNIFHVKTLTLRKKEDIEYSLEEIVDLLREQNMFDGLEMKKDKIHLNNQQSILQAVEIWYDKIDIELNSQGKSTLDMEKSYTNLIKEREKRYGSLERIPEDIIRKYWFGRYSTGKSLVLVISLPHNAWLFRYRKAIATKE